MVIKYVLLDLESGEYFTCYWDEYEIDEIQYSELVAYTESEMCGATELFTYKDAEYYKHCISAEFGYDVEIVRIEE
jgi:hypothetical protein